MTKKIFSSKAASQGSGADRTMVQSPYFYMQSTGSDGADGTAKGFHLRWDFLRNLGASHLPKGNLASSTLNFNRADDFVHIFRSRYEKRFPTIIDFTAQPPDVVHDSLQLWIYLNTNTGTVVYVYFRNSAQYAEVRDMFDPRRDPLKFIEAYGNGVIEVEVKDKLFFAAEFEVYRTGKDTALRAEAVSVVENLPLSDRFVSCRRMFTDENWCGETQQGEEGYKKGMCSQRLVSENIRSVRFDVNEGFVQRIQLETYEDYISGAEWTQVEDEYALSDDDGKVIDQWLESPDYTIHDSWPKFNDGARVNVKNYMDRWDRADGLRNGVLNYISLSDTDPMAMDTLPGSDPADGSIDVSYLDMLKMVALDFHVARMLGQGAVDVAEPEYGGPYIYIARYFTEGLLDMDNEPRFTQHLYMSVPTTRQDYRLPDQPVLKPLRYGLFIDNGQPDPSSLTDAAGYTPDGQARFISLFIRQEDAEPVLGNFFEPPELFCAVDKTDSAFFGIEYREAGKTEWQKPEIAHDPGYVDTGSPAHPVTNPIPNSGDEDKVVLVHEEREPGFHEYSPYGINWFSRPSTPGNIRRTDETVIARANTLIPPSNFQVQLVQEESPLLLTTAQEQADLADPAVVPGPDKTYIRVTFDYFHTHDLNYQFGDRVEIFFREDAPRNVLGAVKSVTDHASDLRLCIVRTESYTNNSTGETVTPALSVSLMGQFAGGIFTSDGKNFIIDSVGDSTIPDEGPIFTLRKIVENTAVSPGGGGDFVTSEVLISPEDGLTFMAVENLADPASWGADNPLAKVISLGHPSWTPVTESYSDDGETITQELRGIWEDADIGDVPETGTGNIIGVYRLQFQTYQLPHHPQSNDPDSVDWYKGVVRVPKAGAPGGPKKVLEVIKIEELGTGQPLRLFAVDNAYDAADPVQTGSGVGVNYYPGYRVYLLADSAHNLDAAHLLPTAGDMHKKTWMAVRSLDSAEGFGSGLGIPAPIIAMGFTEPIAPEEPSGGEYASRPDFYYKSAYTFSVQFTHQPFAAAFYRASEDSVLRALYDDNTIEAIRDQLKQLGEEDPYRADRWKNLLSFDYVYDDPAKPYFDPTAGNPNGTFRRFPREAGNYRFPKPDKAGVFDGNQEPGAVLEDVKAAVYEIFTPLTRQPLLYQYIKGGSYQPVPKPQNIRDLDGNLLDPSDPEFDQAPMAVKLGGNRIQFTDFTLDGSSNMFYFYMGREIGSRGKMSGPGPAAGPVFLIDTRPADAPGIKKMYAVPKGPGTDNPSIEFEINGYPAEQKIRKLEIYRAVEAADALTVRTMDLVKSIGLAGEGIAADANYKVRDDFENGVVPYGDPLYYRIVALREVKNAAGVSEWVPSQPSKLLMTAMIDTEYPPVPQPRFTSDPVGGNPATVSNVVIEWDTTVYNGTYYLEKMNNSGNWNTIHIVKSNAPVISIDLSTIDLGTNSLPKESEDGWVVYNRFRVRVENSSGLFGLEEKVLTI